MAWRNTIRGWVGILAALATAAWAQPSAAAMAIKVLSNRADLISGGDALVEVLLDGADPAAVAVDVDGDDVTGSFGLRSNGRYMGVVTGLAVGANVLTATNTSTGHGAAITIKNHPKQGPIFSGPHLQPWDCTTAGTSGPALGPPLDAHCNVNPKVEWLCSTGGAFSACDPANPPAGLQMLTLNGSPVRAIVRRETGAINRGLYSFAVLHDPAEPQEPWIRQNGWSGRLYYPFQASCNTNQTQGSSKAGAVMVTDQLKLGWAVATTSLNELGHHCNPIISAETAMMTKERFVERYGEIKYTMSTGGSGGAIGQLQVSNAYPGITNGLMPGQMFADVWSTAIEVGDCLLTEAYWPTAVPAFTPLQRIAVDGHAPPGSSCLAWTGTFVPSGIPSHGCFSGATIPPASTPDPQGRDYNAVTNPDGCRATVNDLQFNVWGPRLRDGFAKRPIDNEGVQYGLEALNLPITNEGKITFEHFLDLNMKIGGVDIDGVPLAPRPGEIARPRTRTDPDVPEIAYRTGNIQDGRGLARAAIINFANTTNIEIHTSYHAYALEARLAETNGHADNHAIWHSGPAAVGGIAWNTMDRWLKAVYDAGGIDPLTGMDPQKVVDNRPLTATVPPDPITAPVTDSCWSGTTQNPLSACESMVFGDSRLNAGMSPKHDNLKCHLRPIDPADYADAIPAPTAPQMLLLAQIFPKGVCDYSTDSQGKVPSVQWLTYKDGPGGQPLGPVPTSTAF